MKTAVGTILGNPSVIKSSSQAKQLHAQVVKRQGNAILFAKSAAIILSVYANFNLLRDCLSLFNTFRYPPPSKAWKSIIRCCASNGNFQESIAFFKKMRAAGKFPDRNVFPSLLKTCAHLGDLRFGEAVHGCVIRVGLDSDLFTGNALMSMYVKLEPLNARNVFDGCSEPKGSFEFYNSLNRTVSSARYMQDCKGMFGGTDEKLDSSNENASNELMIVDQNVIFNDNVRSNVDCGDEEIVVVDSVLERRKNSVGKVFETMPVRDVVSWNTVMGGHVQNGMYEEALLTLKDMGRGNLKPDSYTLSTILPIFAKYVDVMKGKEIHGYAVRHGYDKDVFIGSSLIDMYANCMQLEDSYKVFSLSPQKDRVSWNSMIAVCVQNGSFDDGLRYFREMLKAGIEPVAFSFSSIMPACGHLATLCLGRELHGCIIRRGFDDNIFVASSVMDMYAKCGKIAAARWIFDKMEFQDTVSWTAMVMAYALNGHARDAISFFEKMETEGVKPNSGSFLAVLTGCSHGGLVDEAQMYFKRMTRAYAIAPGLEHYAAVSDLLGRAGRLDEAYEFIYKMHIKPTEAIWLSLLSACRVHKNVELAERVAKEVLTIDPKSVNAYVLLSNVYVDVGRWKEAAKLRRAMRKKGVKKEEACSWVEVM
ncbi:putative pentatricopeptide repeat-containing protein At3g23330 [Salvia miltiorrhiza]|uniref:putative pentatricopeptide repeat-containing protein At3g23330 n=1 Tax=Salvia miltiorrhiza TaxID=226208 RepID=UPI0025AB748C|nr:putative pentatricopeptide repeat-containing protein At3g23330 [Salvia miltiorrhiza]